MEYRFAQARKEAGWTQVELAEKLSVTKATVNNWETGFRQPSLERLTQISNTLGVSIAYLLGVDEQIAWTEPVSMQALYIMHCHPVWTVSRGWALVNAMEKTLVFADKSEIPFDAIQESIYAVPPSFALGMRGIGAPLDIDNVISHNRVWVEPITPDTGLAGELRGWYRAHGRKLVENEYGNKFYLDTYGAKWLAFKGCLEKYCHANEENRDEHLEDFNSGDTL